MIYGGRKRYSSGGVTVESPAETEMIRGAGAVATAVASDADHHF